MLPIIQKLVRVDFFSPTKYRMARELGRTDKNLLYKRLFSADETTVGSQALESLCRDICDSYNISEQTLSHLGDIWDLAHRLASVCTKSDLLALTREQLSVVPDTDLRAELRALAKTSALDYSYTLALFITLALGLDPNVQKDTHVLIEVVQNVDGMLRRHFPENAAAHNLSNDYIDQARTIPFWGWCHLMNIVGRIICSYSHPSYIEQMFAESLRTMPIGEESWWQAADADPERTTLYYLLLADEDLPVYLVLALDAERGKIPDAGRCTYFRWAFLKKQDIVRCVQPSAHKLLGWGYYDFAISADGKTLCTCPNKSLNHQHKPLPLPPMLVRVEAESDWGRWIAGLDEMEVLRLLATKDVESLGLEDSGYEVTDVTLSRRVCQVCYRMPDQSPQWVKIELEHYPSLRTISVFDDVFLLRSPIDGKLYALWPDSGLLVRL